MGVEEPPQTEQPAPPAPPPLATQPTPPPRGFIRTRTVVSSAILVAVIVVGFGFVHITCGGGDGLGFCAKESWGLADTFVDLDDYIGKPILANLDKARVIRAMVRCEKLRLPEREERESWSARRERERREQEASSPSPPTEATPEATPDETDRDAIRHWIERQLRPDGTIGRLHVDDDEQALIVWPPSEQKCDQRMLEAVKKAALPLDLSVAFARIRCMGRGAVLKLR